MTSSKDAGNSPTAGAGSRAHASDAPEPLPPALSSMWRLCKLGYRHEPRLMLVAFVLSQLAALPDALLALWLMVLGNAVVQRRPTLLLVAAIGLGVSATATREGVECGAHGVVPGHDLRALRGEAQNAIHRAR